jgi:hypothetical protein
MRSAAAILGGDGRRRDQKKKHGDLSIPVRVRRIVMWFVDLKAGGETPWDREPLSANAAP